MAAKKQAKRAGAKRAAKEKHAKGRKVCRGAPRPALSLSAAPRATRAKVADDLHKVLRKHGIDQRIAELHLAAAAPPPAAAAAAGGAAPISCPPGTAARMVCFFRDGTFVCEERCVPI